MPSLLENHEILIMQAKSLQLVQAIMNKIGSVGCDPIMPKKKKQLARGGGCHLMQMESKS